MACFVPVPLRPQWATLSEALRDELRQQKVESCSVFTKLFADAEDRLATVLELGGSESDVEVITQLLLQLQIPAAAEVRRLVSTPMPEVAVAATLAARHRERNLRELRQASISLPAPSKRTAATLDGLTVVSRRRLSSLDTAANARESAEDRRREKWLHELRCLIVSSNLPAAVIAGKMSDPALLLDGLGRGRRASTTRRRVIDWKAAARYFALTFGTPWPQDVAQVIEYISTLIAGEATQSRLDRVLHALAFMERAGGSAPSIPA